MRFSVSDLWFWSIKVGFSHNAHVSGGHLPLDGPWGDPESAHLRNMWHLLVWRGQYLYLLNECAGSRFSISVSL